jgi:hypothetical protein
VRQRHSAVTGSLLHLHRTAAFWARPGDRVSMYQHACGGAQLRVMLLLELADRSPQRREGRERELAFFFARS